MDQFSPTPFIPPAPTPPAAPLPLRGFLRAIRTNSLTLWPESAYHQDITQRRFIGRSNVLLCCPDAIHHVLVDNHANYRRSRASIRILRPIAGDGLLLSQGESWRQQRRTIAPALAPRVLPMLTRHIAATTQEVMPRLAAQAERDVDLLAEMQALALEIAGRSMFSLETQQFGPAMRREITIFGARHAQPHLMDMVLPPSVPTIRDVGRHVFRRRWMRLIDAIMQARLQAPATDAPRDLFDLLRLARDPETGAGFSMHELRDQIATMILAGHETTALTLCWALTLLAQAPDWQDWVAEEAAGAELTRDAAATTLTRLPRTRAVISETLRLFPPIFTMVREVARPDRIGALILAPTDVVMIAPWVLHRHHKLWDRPAAFDPTRFLPGAPPPPRFAYLPFGAGPRVCIGAQFALAEATIVLAAVIQRFQVSLASDRPVLPVGVITTRPDHAPPFRLRAR
ncbi:MAG: cytochrome P450 [Acetobacteraceae bacterium]